MLPSVIRVHAAIRQGTHHVFLVRCITAWNAILICITPSIHILSKLNRLFYSVLKFPHLSDKVQCHFRRNFERGLAKTLIWTENGIILCKLTTPLPRLSAQKSNFSGESEQKFGELRSVAWAQLSPPFFSFPPLSVCLCGAANSPRKRTSQDGRTFGSNYFARRFKVTFD